MPNIKGILKRISRSQDELSKEVGVSQSAVNHYANGKRKPSYEMAWKIVEALNTFGAECAFDDVFPNPQQTSTSTTEIDGKTMTK
ncbi:transcriptional regulator [Vibrio navarrensis]|uniref:helix-turn-helix transcriptional regulator n=1 Tax=Vibrio navarrensis TaxID=29495 RepID=UPI00186659B7|nr:helix-turn-helix transcriptional regulator [Vibrio navarrensis]MBE3662152.1 transcriptional regulator [Vibrio navarrensis]